MKRSTKFFATAFAAAALFAGSAVKAQTTTTTAGTPSPWRLGFGLEGGVVVGAVHTTTDAEIGATARLQYNATQNLSYMITSGFYDFISKNSAGYQTNSGTTTNFGNTPYATSPHYQGMVPVKIGAKYFYTKGFYADGEAGAGFETKYGEKTKLLLSPGFGYANKSWDVGVRYEGYFGQSNNYGLIGLRLAYGFGI